MDNPNRIMGFPDNIGAVEPTRLARIALRQNGLFTRTQAQTCGYTPSQIRRRVSAGEWSLHFGSVLARSGLSLTPAVRDRAAYLAVPGSVLGAASAARRWKLPVPAEGTHLIMPRRLERVLPGITVERAEVGRRDANLIDGVHVTAIERTIFDCLRTLPLDHAARLLDHALQRGITTIESLAGRLHHATGRRGMPQARQLVAAAASGARSAAERRLVALLSRAGVTGWAANVPIHDGRGFIGVGDVVFEEERLVLEVDGWAYHSAGPAFQRDRTRQNRLILAGWTILRFTWQDLTSRPDEVLATIRAALVRRDT